MSSSLRILFLDSWHPAPHEGSGTAVGISTLHRGLLALGHRVDVLRPPRGTASLSGRRDFNRTLPQKIRAAGAVDVVVGFDMDGLDWGATRPAASRYVVALKGIAADEARFSRTAEERRLLSALAGLERRNALTADRVLVPSVYSAQVAHRAYGIPEDTLRIVPEAIETSLWEDLTAPPSPGHPSSGESPPPARSPTILSVAHQYPRKDTATLLRALALLRADHPDVRLRVVGGGPELGNLRRLAGELGLGESVTFHGALPDDQEVRRSYLTADVFCLPSLQEGFGIVFLEAMAAGLPIVAVRAGAVPEVVTHGEVGLLVEPGNPVALAGALGSLLGDAGARRKLGAAGRRRARDFDLAPVTSTFLAACGGGDSFP